MAAVNDEVVEVGLQPDRGPALFGGPSAGAVRDREAARAALSTGGDQDAAVRGHGRLHDGEAPPRVLPEPLAIGGRDAGRARCAQLQDLRDSVDRRQLRRAVAHAAVRPGPAQLAGGEVVGDELAADGDDDGVVHHQGRAREAPVRDLRLGVGRRVARPHDGAVPGVERVHDSGRTEGVDTTVAERRRRARTGARVRLEESGSIAVCPHRLAGGGVVAGDHLVVTALLLGVEEVATDREGRPARSDRPAPQLDRRRCRPVGLDPHSGDGSVAAGSPIAGPVGCRLHSCRGRRVAMRRHWLVAGLGREPFHGSLRRWGSRRAARNRRQLAAGLGEGLLLGSFRGRSRRARRRLAAGLGEEPFLGALRPTPPELRIVVAVDAVGPDEHPRSAGEQDGRGHRRTPRSSRKAAAGCRPGDQGEAQAREGISGEPQRPHRLVSEVPGPGQPDDHQDDGSQAFGPGRPAEEHPPQDDSQRGAECPHHPELKAPESGDDGFQPEPGQQQQQCGGHAGPQPEGLPRSRFGGLRDGHVRPLRAPATRGFEAIGFGEDARAHSTSTATGRWPSVVTTALHWRPSGVSTWTLQVPAGTAAIVARPPTTVAWRSI